MNNINNFKKQTKSSELVCKDNNIINNNLSKVNFMKKSLNMKKGFTLIELLVVVAIIGTLTAIVLIGVNNGRRAGRESAIQQSMNQVLTEAELHRAQNQDKYTGFAIPTNIIEKIEQQGATDPTVRSSDTTFIAYTDMDGAGAGTKYYCVDSNQNSKTLTTNPRTSVTSCP